jgi:hypothetical protein
MYILWPPGVAEQDQGTTEGARKHEAGKTEGKQVSPSSGALFVSNVKC